MKKDDCIFCKLANGDIPTRKIYEDDNFVVFMDMSPATKGHSLVVPKDHYANLFEMPAELAGEAMKVAQKVAAKMTDALQADGFNIVQNNGEVAGQTVFHFHMHLIPRYKEDNKAVLFWNPQSASAEELDEVKATILKQESDARIMRTICVSEITQNIKEMCIEANHFLTPDMKKALQHAVNTEKSNLGQIVLGQLQENLDIAGQEMIPICQDTGMAVIFMEIGQDVHFEGGSLAEAIHEGVRQGYTEGYLRKSVVKDPLIRENTKDNTPAIIHYNIVPGDKVKITVAPKGFGSENMSRVFMLKPADGIEGVKNAVLSAVLDAGPNACPPMVVGVGIGGTFEKCALMAKEALIRSVEERSNIPYVREMEEELLQKINCSGIGPGGLGGTTTALAVNINTYPTHIAGLPVAVNICCHVNRHAVRVL